VDLNWSAQVATNKDSSTSFLTSQGTAAEDHGRPVPTTSGEPKAGNASQSDNLNALAKFQIDTLNIQGSVKILIMEEGFPNSKLIAKVDIPVLPLLDCTLGQEKPSHCYERWFPLLLVSRTLPILSALIMNPFIQAEECIPAEGEFGNMEQNLPAEIKDYVSKDYIKLGYDRPTIKLRFNWIPDVASSGDRLDKHGKVIGSESYYRFQFPQLSMSVIDADRRREIMQINFEDVECRQFTTKFYTEQLVVVSNAQV
jgi:hypothetical protein